MKSTAHVLLLTLLLVPVAKIFAEPAPPATLRSLGAVGDGITDDRAAIESALTNAKGAPVDGEGLTYAVHGNIDVGTDVDLRNAILVQTMGPADTSAWFPSARGVGTLEVDPPDAYVRTVKDLPYLRADGIGTYANDPVLSDDDLTAVLPGIVLRTLSVRGDAERRVSVRLEHIKIDRGRHPESGGRSDGAGLHLSYAGPVDVRDLEITGDGKGTGLDITHCENVRLERLHIHDMNWAPYAGDHVLDHLPIESMRDDFGWNNFPIYEYRTGLKRFVRVRIQEQLVGLFLNSSRNVEILNARIDRLQTRIGDTLYPLQSDGITMTQTVNVVLRDCDITTVWEGIDFTGMSGSDFVFERCTVADTIAWAIKLAHPKQNGKIIDCTTTRAGLAGFIVGADSENIELINCRALETGANNYWTRADGSHVMTISGIFVESGRDLPTPKQITIRDCSAINDEHPGTIDCGILCEAKVEGRDIRLINPTVRGARVEDIRGITPEKK